MIPPNSDHGPTLYIIGGCNGAGKTTASFTVLPDLLNCYEFVNADEIAKGLSPFRPESVAIEAGRLMLHRIDELMNKRVDFAFETTLAASLHLRTIAKAQALGYRVHLLFFWLESVELAQQRVQSRVKEGGHWISSEVIARRYRNGLIRLIDDYLPMVDHTLIFNNSQGRYVLIAEKETGQGLITFDRFVFEKLTNSYELFRHESGN